jgi:hypothetical protein
MNVFIPILELFIPVATWTMFVLAAGTWFFIPRSRHVSYFSRLIWTMAFLRVLYAALATFGQYKIWADPVFKGVFFENNYFAKYSLSRFWLNVALSFLFAFLFWLFLERLKRHRERFFEEGEVLLGTLAALIVGWPLQPVFVIAVFFSVVIISVFRSVAFKEMYTTLGGPFLLATLICLLFGLFLLHNAGWDYLKI